MSLQEIPSHSHDFVGSRTLSETENVSHIHGIPSLSGSTSTNGDHYHGFNNGGYALTVFTSTSNPDLEFVNGYDKQPNAWFSNTNKNWSGISSSGNHYHSVTTNASSTGGESTNHAHYYTPSGTVKSSGGSTAHNNTPPYISVYMWKRIK